MALCILLLHFFAAVLLDNDGQEQKGMMANFRASSSSPVWLSYRAIGSSGGQAEFIGANNG
eukprot:1149766-Pelagomonas_calceolata.AAC.2